MDNELVQLLLDYGYVIMFLLMIVEGPVVTLVAALLASLGFFSLPIVFMLSIVGDLLGDVLWYGIGRKWGQSFMVQYGRFVGISQELINRVQKFFDRYGGRAVFGAKSTTGLCLATFIVAGAAGMPLRVFLVNAFMGGVVWTSILVALGYFFGTLYLQIAQYIAWAGWFVFGSALVSIVLLSLYKSRCGDRLLMLIKK
jgi:membrane-associated protein